MKKNVKRVAKAKGPNTNSTIERSCNEGSDSKSIHETSSASENQTTAEKPWNPCDFYYY